MHPIFKRCPEMCHTAIFRELSQSNVNLAGRLIVKWAIHSLVALLADKKFKGAKHYVLCVQ